MHKTFSVLSYELQYAQSVQRLLLVHACARGDLCCMDDTCYTPCTIQGVCRRANPVTKRVPGNFKEGVQKKERSMARHPALALWLGSWYGCLRTHMKGTIKLQCSIK